MGPSKSEIDHAFPSTKTWNQESAYDSGACNVDVSTEKRPGDQGFQPLEQERSTQSEVTTESGRVVAISSNVLQVLKLSQGSVIGKSLCDIFSKPVKQDNENWLLQFDCKDGDLLLLVCDRLEDGESMRFKVRGITFANHKRGSYSCEDPRSNEMGERLFGLKLSAFTRQIHEDHCQRQNRIFHLVLLAAHSILLTEHVCLGYVDRVKNLITRLCLDSNGVIKVFRDPVLESHSLLHSAIEHGIPMIVHDAQWNPDFVDHIDNIFAMRGSISQTSEHATMDLVYVPLGFQATSGSTQFIFQAGLTVLPDPTSLHHPNSPRSEPRRKRRRELARAHLPIFRHRSSQGHFAHKNQLQLVRLCSQIEQEMSNLSQFIVNIKVSSSK